MPGLPQTPAAENIDISNDGEISGIFQRDIEMNKELECCTICPHNCKINRTKNPGRCKSTDKIKIALYSIHNFEEPCISGEKGSGTIFFSKL